MSLFHRRVEQLRGVMRSHHIEALLVSNFVNVSYLTGFTGDDSFLLLTRNRVRLISDPRYAEQIGEECPGLEVVIRKPSVPILAATSEVIRGEKLGAFAIEGRSMVVSAMEELRGLVEASIMVSDGWVEELREIKDKTEIGRIRRAIAMAESAFQAVRSRLTPATSERDIANELDQNIRHLGGKGVAFSTIVGVGARAALPHGVPSHRRLEDAPFVLIDWGANEGQYLSDLTRVLVTSRIPTKFEKAFHAVLEAHRQAASELRAGVTASSIDVVARQVLAKAGLEKKFTHGLGHGFGLQIHESPRLGKGHERVLRPGMVVTIEPGVYVPGWGGIRIEDDYLITENGSEKLTNLPQDLEANFVQLL